MAEIRMLGTPRRRVEIVDEVVLVSPTSVGPRRGYLADEN
jgi:hypothetical protein